MILDKYSLQLNKIDLIKPILVNGVKYYDRQIAILTLHSQDQVFFAELSPLPGLHAETLEEAMIQLEEFLKTYLPFDTEKLTMNKALFGISENVLYPSVQFAIESIFLNFFVSEKLHSISVNELLSTEELTHFNNLKGCYKIKVSGKSSHKDADRILSFLEDNPGVFIRLDGNQSFSLEQYLSFSKIIPPNKIEYFEEPFNNYKLSFEIPELLQFPLAIDENLELLLDKKLPPKTTAVIIKPQKYGLLKSRQYIHWAYENQLTPIISSCFEASIGMRTLIQLINLPELSYLKRLTHGLGTYRYLRETNPIYKIAYNDNSILVQ